MEEYFDDDMIVCRCEEITVGEIKIAVREGARDVVGVKRRSRAASISWRERTPAMNGWKHTTI